MRIHRLTFRGIGPFKDEQSLDIDEVGQQGLFLLDGPTGVGKSTIVDAIVFALFGEPATQDGKDRMVSDFLGQDIPKAERPYVELTVTTSAGTYRIRREPKSPYTSRKGDTREHAATVQLWRLANEGAADGELISNRAEEVGREVVDMLGLDRSQVLSTMFLAQGQFARFLQAGSDERRTILQRVFNTEPYAQLQRDLVNARKEAFRTRSEARARLSQAIAVLAHAAQWEMDPGEFTETYCRQPRVEQEGISARLAVFQNDLDVLREQLTAGREEAARADREWRTAQDRTRLVERKLALVGSQAALQLKKTDMDELEAMVAAARAAAPLAVAHDLVTKCTTQADQADQDALVVLRNLPASEHGLTSAELGQLQEQVTREQNGLAEALLAEEQLPAKRQATASLDDRITRMLADRASDSRQVEELPEVVRALTDECDGLARAAALEEHAAQTLQAAQGANERLRKVEALREAQERDFASVREASRLSQAADQLLDLTVQQYRSGLAAELADLLVDGQPCTVCGSQTHPSPALKAVDHVSADTVDLRDSEARILRDRLAERQQQLVATESVLELEETRLGGQDSESLALAEKQAKQALQEAVDAGLLLRRRKAELADHVESLDAAAKRIQALDVACAAAVKEREILLEQVSAAQKLVNEHAAGFDSVAARHGALRDRIEALAGAVKACEIRERAHLDLIGAQRAFDARLADSPFSDAGSVLASAQPSTWIEDSEAVVLSYRDQVSGLTAQLQSPELEGVGIDETYDLEALERTAVSAASSADVCQKREIDASRRVQQCTDANASVKSAWAAVERTHDATAPLIRLADLANGDSANHHHIELRTYVVMRRFAEVVDAANAHLASMSDGRYRLEATGGGVGLERKIGLALHVYDDRTDAARTPGTLSGGETFYVSLSLALGLADVVQAEAGGVSLETLFVDEGFGSLDAETLDTVMNVLTRLGRGSRTVGLISHVEELKRRIPDRIEIHRPDPNGPSQVKIRL
ncbi:MAG: SMC family ATPase [Candidatus Nanopelagicales bacterium]|jgi:exonuclease SbcC|nr:SMC family ATPase [Candidatus Nanopelagicales bacterium]